MCVLFLYLFPVSVFLFPIREVCARARARDRERVQISVRVLVRESRILSEIKSKSGFGIRFDVGP